jgi:methyl-accepting chemotaxis protein
MNKIIAALTVKKRFLLLLAMFTIGFVAYGLWSFKTLNELQINSTLYQRITQGKDLVADVLPPPEYILESYLVTLELANATDKKDQALLIRKFQQLKDEYDTRHQYWLNQGLTGELAPLFLEQSYLSAYQFYNLVLAELIPAIQESDRASVTTILPRLTKLYKNHRLVIDKIIPILIQRTVADEALATEKTHTGNLLMLVILLTSLAASMILGFAIAHSFVIQLGGEPSDVVVIAKQIALGHLDNDINLTKGDDDSLLAAINLMQIELQRIISQLQDHVDYIIKGDFTQQIDLSDKSGFELEISRTINSLNSGLLHKIGGNPDDVAYVAQQIAAGHLDNTLSVRQGDSESITAAMANMSENLQAIITDINHSVNAAVHGDFSYRMDENRHQGYAKTLAELSNNLNKTSENALSDIGRIANALAIGDLTQRIDKKYSGLFGITAQGINDTRSSLLSLINEIISAVSVINSSASEIAAGFLDLSQRTEQQASSLEENSATMEELASTVKQNAENARVANNMVLNTSTLTTKGGSAVDEVIKTMDSISKSASTMIDIVEVIDGLAFQTNILALNAAVEAASAGAHGKGFSVVASEVRLLALRSTSAAKEIKDLINNSVMTTKNGSNQVDIAGKTMIEISNAVTLVTDLVSQISSASSEQSTGIDQLNIAMLQMDNATQQNASLAEQSAAAAQTLEDQARQLQSLVGTFRIR